MKARGEGGGEEEEEKGREEGKSAVGKVWRGEEREGKEGCW